MNTDWKNRQALLLRVYGADQRRQGEGNETAIIYWVPVPE